ncbi:MAG: VanZ family protein [Chloroflexi bacterium]|nr:VanZ family protein [Chloroflexota bacterium]
MNTDKRPMQNGLLAAPWAAWVMLALWSAGIWFVNTRSRVFSIGQAATDYVLYQAGHFFGHVVLGLLAMRASTLTWGWRKGAWVALAGALAHAVLDELAQLFVPSRHANLEDIVYNMAGVLVGSVALLVMRQRGRTRS